MMINNLKNSVKEPFLPFTTALMHVLNIMYMKISKISRMLVIYLKIKL